MVSEEPAVFQERFSQAGTMADPAGCFARLSTDGIEVLADELGHVGSGQVTPEVFDRVELRCVRRQILCDEPRRLLRDPCLNLAAAMGRQPIPQQDGFSSAKVSLERLQIRQDLRLLHRAGLKPQTQADAAGCRSSDQTGDCRQTLPVERRDQDRSLTTSCPGSTHAGTLRKPAFIQENQQGIGFASLFLIRGQR